MLEQTFSAEEWVAKVEGVERAGDFLTAYDLANRGLEAHPDHLGLRYLAVRTLARSGATEQARARFDEYGLAGRPEVDISALGARLEKDYALEAEGAERASRAVITAGLYEVVFDRTGDYYPGVNAATMWLLAGKPARATDLARRVLDALSRTSLADPGKAYYRAATEAEAALLLDDLDNAGAALERAAAAHGGDYAALATTRRQLRLICAERAIDPAILAPLTPPRVITFLGHMISAPGAPGRFPAESEHPVAQRIAAHLDEGSVGFGYGSLACGADILFAETLLSSSAELHVVLPFDKDEFKRISVKPGGPGWSRRFDDCLAKATSITYATEDSYMGDDLLFTYAARLAMGLALLRATFLDAEVEQAAVWDGKEAGGEGGTATDVTFWRSIGMRSHVIDVAAPTAAAVRAVRRTVRQPVASPGFSEHERAIRAMLFSDFKGFSKLREPQLPVFHKEVMGSLGAVLDRYGSDVLYRNTWGDGLFVVASDAPVAAQLALDLQAAMGVIDLKALGLPAHLALRVGAHVGPVFEGYDYVVKDSGYFGSHVTRTARLEPATPEGNVYVTEPFAAGLALDGDASLTCEYVGHMPAAKGYGLMRMYVLKRRRR